MLKFPIQYISKKKKVQSQVLESQEMSEQI